MRSHAKATSAIAAIGCAIFLACICASPALAAKGVVGFVGGEGVEGGQFANPGGVAVNQSGAGGVSPGEVYVVDRGNNRIQEFHADGTFVRAWGWGVATEAEAFEICTVAATCLAGLNSAEAGAFNSPQGLAIEPSTGNIYVTDQLNRRVAVYSATGAFEGAFGRGVKASDPQPELQFCTTATGCLSGGISPSAGAFGLAIGFPTIAPAGSPAAGHLFVPNKTNRRVDEFTAQLTGTEVTGVTYVKGFGWNVNAEAPAEEFQTCTTATGCKVAAPAGPDIGRFAVNSPTSVGVDSNGRIYAIDAGVNNRVQTFSATPSPEGAFAPALLSGAPVPTDLSVDPTTNHLLVLKKGSSGEQRILEFDSTGKLLATFEKGGGMPGATGIGAVSGGGDIYLSTTAGLEGMPGVWILSSTLVPPQVTIEPVSTFTGTTASFEGHVSTDAIGAKYHFEYSTDGASWTQIPGDAVPANSSSQAVSAATTGLEAHAEYQVRLVADKEFAGGTASAQTSFTTGSEAPIIGGVSHSHVGDTTALLSATINPENEDTEYSFEYTDKATYEAEEFDSATSVPAPPGQLSGGAAKEVSQQLAGLEQKTTYVYRLLVSNPTGDDESTLGTFTTHATPQSFESCSNDQFRINRPSQILPDCRAYEQASPINKNGGNIQSQYKLTKASPSGDRISFLGLAGLPGGEGSQTFPTYLATRGDGNWSTQGVLPAASSGERALVRGWTPDFDQVFSTAEKLGTGTGIVSRSSQNGALSTVAPYSDMQGPKVNYVGASADGSVAFFDTPAELPVAPESKLPAAGLSNEAGGVPLKNLYAWNRETGDLYFAGVLPDGSAAAQGSLAGIDREAGYSIDSHAVTGDGSVYFTDQETGQLYRRLNPTAPETTNYDPISGECIPDPVLACTVHVSASEKTDGGGIDGHDAAGPQASRFMAASTDGSKAIFTSSEKLTNDAYTGVEPEPAAIARADAEHGDNVDLSWLPGTADQIDIDETAGYVYWTDPSHERIGRAKLDKSEIDENLITGLHNLKGLAVVDEPGSEYLFWTSPADGEAEGTSPTTGNGTIGRAGLGGQGPQPDCLTGIVNPRSIAASSEFIYWTAPEPKSSLGGGFGGRAALDCSEASVNQQFLLSASVNGDVAVDDGHIYASVFNQQLHWSFVGRFTPDGTQDGFSIVKVENVNEPIGVASDGAHLYWTNPVEGKVGRADLEGSEASQEPNFITNAGRPTDLAVDSEHIYWSANQGTTPNNGSDIYSYDSEAPEGHRLTDLAPEDNGKNGIEVQGVLGASADASYVYFVANGVPDGDIANSPNARNEEAQAGDCKGTFKDLDVTGSCNLYLAHEGQITFITRFNAKNSGGSGQPSTSDALNWIASVDEIGIRDNSTEKTARVSADGQTLLFRSQRQLTGYDNQGPKCSQNLSVRVPGPCVEYYRYRAGEPGLTCVSCNPTGAPPFWRATLVSIVAGATSTIAPAPQLSRNLSADGNRVFFESADALVAADTNGDEGCEAEVGFSLVCQDVYEWEAAGTGSCPASAGQEGCIYLLSTGKSPDPSFFGDASLSGDDAFLFSYSKLVRQDEDNQLDVYDAHVEGGLSSQEALAAVPCEGEACKGGAGSPPQSPSAATQSFSGAANPKPAHKKAKKRHHKKRRHHAKKRHAKQQHRANANGRASR